MSRITFEWDSGKDRANQGKHGISFSDAQLAFWDPHRVIAKDLKHSDVKNVIFVLAR